MKQPPKDNFELIFRRQPIYKPNQPCRHLGCLSHITHPCEGCGRIGGLYPPGTPPYNKELADKLIEKYNDERWDRALAFRHEDKIKVYDEDDDYIGEFTDEKFIKWMRPTSEIEDEHG